MEEQRGLFSISTMCHALEVSPSTYYAWRRRGESRRHQEDRRLLVEIKAVHARSKQRYGASSATAVHVFSPRIYRALRAADVRCSENRVARLMRLHGIRAKQAHRFKATTDSDHQLPVAENILERQFAVDVPDARWAADITYIWTREGWLYLAVVMDLFSRRIVGWSMQQTLARALVVDALRMALEGRRPAIGLIHHSDRGSQYASREYRALMESAGCTCSMSRRGNCWDNAPVESFFSTLKRELVHGRLFQTRAEARLEIFEFIEVWYNRERLHSSLGYLSPVAFEKQMITTPTSLAA